ncbi:MAG: sigma-70 family RNA polymerase sigma factor [Leptospiraceae bacterium]|nr:sigma-70 family RNA polymerase sigma factor [Leptospiraceae bacterium]
MILLLYSRPYLPYYSKNNMVEYKDSLSRLMAETQAGNSNSYRILLNQISITLSKFLSKRIGSVDDREDVLQEILIAIHSSRHTYLPAKPFYPWMYAIAKNTLVKYYKRIQKINANQIVAEIENISSPKKHESDEVERTNEIIRLVNELPGKQKQIIQMLKIQGLSIKEVSAKLKLSEANVKVIAHRGYHTLRKVAKK